MAASDRPALADIPDALALLSRLPIPVDPGRAAARGARAAWAWPLAGACLGSLAGAAGWLALGLGLPPAIAAGLALASLPILTGAMHEDGLADSADGLWGGWTRERRLEIMKDSAIGTYGVTALILALGLRWLCLATLFATGTGVTALIAAATLSRLAMTGLSCALPPARPAGLSARVGRPSRTTTALATLTALAIAVPLTGTATLAALAATLAAAVTVGALARARIGGQTGDILGAGQQLAEIAILLTLVALA